jgi:glutamate--cysteine ligase
MDMNSKNIAAIAAYLKSGEKSLNNLKIGIECEHFAVDKATGEPSPHVGDQPSSRVLEALKPYYPEQVISDGLLIGLKSAASSISVEPGGQLELSLAPLASISEVEAEYRAFLDNANDALAKLNLEINAVGYLPKGSVYDMPILAKSRYKYMSEYFLSLKGLGINMMKGTASLQASIDYTSEEDFIEKYRLASLLSLPIYYMTDNTAVFEGKPASPYTRLRIWQQTDPARCGVIPGSLAGKFGYGEYAEYAYTRPALVALGEDGEPYYAANTLLSELFAQREMSEDDISYALSMLFLDARAIRFIEIRPADSLPFDAAMGYFAFIYAAFYTKAFGKLKEKFASVGEQEYRDTLKGMLNEPEKTSIYGYSPFQLSIDMLEIAYNELPAKDRRHILSLRSFLENREAASLIGYKQTPTRLV